MWSHLQHSDTMLSLAARINANTLYFLQLAGIAVLAIGLWLRFDSQTKSIFEQENSQASFYTGNHGEIWFFLQLQRCLVDPGTWPWQRHLLWPHWSVMSLASLALCSYAHEFAFD